MCTIVVLNGVRADFPVVLATNRDEFFARPATGAVRLLEAPRTVGGRDVLKGGAWMGVTRDGLFVGVTNYASMRPPDPNKRSRGEVVINALKQQSSAAITHMVGKLDGREYNGFNLLFGDASGLSAAYGRPDQQRVELEPVPPGVHVLPNDRLDSPSSPKVQRAQTLIEPVRDAPYDQLERALADMLADRALPALDTLPALAANAPIDRETLRELSALCIRTPLYGTRSSTIVALAPGRVAHYAYADGPPDRTPFQDVLGLF